MTGSPGTKVQLRMRISAHKKGGDERGPPCPARRRVCLLLLCADPAGSSQTDLDAICDAQHSCRHDNLMAACQGHSECFAALGVVTELCAHLHQRTSITRIACAPSCRPVDSTRRRQGSCSSGSGVALPLFWREGGFDALQLDEEKEPAKELARTECCGHLDRVLLLIDAAFP